MDDRTTIYIDKETIIKAKGTIGLNQDKSHYMLRVMRCKQGDEFTVIDGQGGRYTAIVDNISGGEVMVKIKASFSPEPNRYNTILCQGIIKGNLMDEVIRQAAELGIREIMPLVTERTLVRHTNKLQRWRKIAEEACEQCGRSHLPLIHEPVSMEAVIKSFPCSNKALGIFFKKDARDLQDVLSLPSNLQKDIYLIVGPEGGLSESELFGLEEAGFNGASLAAFTLRSKTAALIAVALTHYFIERRSKNLV